MAEGQLVQAIREAAHLIGGGRADHAGVIEMARDARFVLLGEATHGTHDLYRERARITQRLIEELGFNGVAIEADWPDADRVNRWCQGLSDDGDAEEALRGFRRFPTWMWRNTVVVDFAGWLRERNESSHERPVLFHGMDLYSLHSSVEAVLDYLQRVDPEAAERAQGRYACFEIGGRAEDSQAYGRAVRLGVGRDCEKEAVAQLVELHQRASGTLDPDLFSAEQNARLARNAEAYYRAMFGSRISTWNLRDRHMAETLENIAAYLERRDGYARIVVWAHNSHLGDARATQMGEDGELNVGQLVRERHGREALLVGFTTSEGTVTAADDWGGPGERMRVRSPLPESVEALLHEVGLPRFFLPLRDAAGPLAALRSQTMLERAIGVIYRPRTERYSHYFDARVGEQFDALVHVDRSRAVEPLERTQLWDDTEAPETYPSAL